MPVGSRAVPDGGFTLLEVTVAFVIAALAIGTMMSGTTTGLRATDRAAKYTEAVSLARSHLAAIGRGEAIAEQDTGGIEGDGFSWHLRVRPIGTRQLTMSEVDRANDTPPTAAILFEIEATESWKDAGRTRSLTLATRRIDTRAQQQ